MLQLLFISTNGKIQEKEPADNEKPKATDKPKAGKQKTTFQESQKATSKKMEKPGRTKKPDQVKFSRKVHNSITIYLHEFSKLYQK